MNLELGNQHVVVVGGARGLGFAVAQAFAAEGARASLLDVSPDTPDSANRLASEFSAAPRPFGHVVDACDEAAMNRAADAVCSSGGPVDHVVFAAAIGSGHFGFPFWKTPATAWPKVLAVNLLGAVHTAHAFAPAMAERKHGSLLFISSVAGQIGSQTDPPYSASKAALINFSQCAAKDLAPHGVRVNSLCPGMIKTTLNHAVWKSWADRQTPETWQSYDDWTAAKIKQIVPLNRWQSPEDIAAMIVFLASKRGENVTGQTINVDGGYVMHW